MSKRIGWLVAVSVAVVFIAVIGLPHATETEQASAGWCATIDDSGNLVYIDVPPRIRIGRSGVKICEEDHDGSFLSDRQYERISNPPDNFLTPDRYPVKDFPDGWFESLAPCSEPLLQSGDVLPNTTGPFNRIEDVYAARSAELAVQIAYDVGSNELTGIIGAIIGAILGVVKVPAFTTEWKYEVQDECQEIVERNTIQDINVDTQRIVSDVKTLLQDVATRASQTSVDDVDAKVMQISTTLGNLATSLTDETDEIDAALAALAASLSAETDEIDAALAGLKDQLVAGQDQSVRLFIEDHLERCRPLGSLLLSDSAGLLPLTVLVVEDLAARADTAGLAIGNARLHLDRANDSILAGDAREGFQSLCTAYEQIVRGRGG